MTVTISSTFRNETAYPFCPGCGHGSILDSLDEALRLLGRDPAAVVIVSDIGCAGLSDPHPLRARGDTGFRCPDTQRLLRSRHPRVRPPPRRTVRCALVVRPCRMTPLARPEHHQLT